MNYDHRSIEKKWQALWQEHAIFEAKDDSHKEPYYLLVEFPYPSGAGLHMGHPRSYTAMDILARKKRMEGKNVLYPIGWDAFGLPTENYAIKTGRKPQEVTKENTDTFRRQLQSLGLSFDWSREINTTDPQYYKWTQWMFLQFYNAGLVYKDAMPINWCTQCKIGLANEEVVGGVCERCGSNVEKRNKEQWMIAITKYAQRLLDDLDTVDYVPKIKKQQQDWIGRSEGAEIDFPIEHLDKTIRVFTTRPDTVFGATYMVLAPEHPFVDEIMAQDQVSEVKAYREATQAKTDIERADDTKEKTGVFTGAYAINPANEKRIPIWIADYVMMGYGTGAIMAVPAHDERDFAFAKKFQLLKINVVDPAFSLPAVDTQEIEERINYLNQIRAGEEIWIHDGLMRNSDILDNLETHKAKEKIIAWLEQEGKGVRAVNYKLRDWVFSRQRYWGEPIPLVKCESCGWVPVPEEQLPVTLPEVDSYEPTDTGESPLATIDEWVNTTCPSCKGDAKRETDTMPNWAGSSWYFLRYIDPTNDRAFADVDKLKTWMPVDLYNGGMEHTTLHLLYSRFWHKALYDLGFVHTPEPYARRHSHGLILASDGQKMSKSRGNVVNPDEIIDEYGADALRVYQMFVGPFEEPVPWNTNGLVGVRRFLEKVVRLKHVIAGKEEAEVTRALHKTIKKVSEDIESMRFNTAVSELMIFVNTVQGKGSITKQSYHAFLKLLCPFAPHLSNELAQEEHESRCLEEQAWPEYNAALAKDKRVKIVVQVNGKRRAEFEVDPEATEEEVHTMALKDEQVTRFLTAEPKKVIFVKGKLINFVV